MVPIEVRLYGLIAFTGGFFLLRWLKGISPRFLYPDHLYPHCHDHDYWVSFDPWRLAYSQCDLLVREWT